MTTVSMEGALSLVTMSAFLGMFIGFCLGIQAATSGKNKPRKGA